VVLPEEFSLASLGFGGPRSMVELRERKWCGYRVTASDLSHGRRMILFTIPAEDAPRIAVAPWLRTSLNYLGKIGVPGENSAHDLSLGDDRL